MLDIPWRKRKPGTQDYIDKDQLAEEVQRCIDNGRQASDNLASMFTQMVDHMLVSRHFNGYNKDLKEEMRSYANYKFVRSMQRVDLSKCKNVFNYYSRTIWLAFLTVIAKWKKQKEKEIEYLENYGYGKSEKRSKQKYVKKQS